MQVLKDWFGHPYSDEDIANAPRAVEGKTEMDALIAHLQNLGTAIKTVR
jgi:cytochrome c oxidase cbb3-type subunit 2